MSKFEAQFNSLGKNTEKYKIFSTPIEKQVTKIDNDRNKNVVTISYETKFTDRTRLIIS